jgi:hypothetical protein
VVDIDARSPPLSLQVSRDGRVALVLFRTEVRAVLLDAPASAAAARLWVYNEKVGDQQRTTWSAAAMSPDGSYVAAGVLVANAFVCMCVVLMPEGQRLARRAATLHGCWCGHARTPRARCARPAATRTRSCTWRCARPPHSVWVYL